VTGCRNSSLADLVLALMGRYLPKDPAVRRSNWAGPLSEEQKLYAALDAYASYRVTVRIRDALSMQEDRCVNKCAQPQLNPPGVT
jgi:ribonuclease D